MVVGVNLVSSTHLAKSGDPFCGFRPVVGICPETSLIVDRLVNRNLILERDLALADLFGDCGNVGLPTVGLVPETKLPLKESGKAGLSTGSGIGIRAPGLHAPN
jgi:hypothetical protein